MKDDHRETIAALFERTAKLATGMVPGAPTELAAALAVGATVANVIAGLVRSAGVDGAALALASLAERRSEGAIRVTDLAVDDASIAEAVADMFARGVPKPAPVPLDAFDGVSPDTRDDPPTTKSGKKKA